MSPELQARWADLWSNDRAAQNAAYASIMALTEQPVDWAYAVWDEVVANLTHADNHNRAIAAQVLAHLAHSDPEQRIVTDLPALFAVTHDERFVTARHALQLLWKVALTGTAQQGAVIDGLVMRYHDCSAEKNSTLIRHDIVKNLRQIFDATHDEAVKTTALALIELETDPKYRKKYAGLWRNS